MKVCKVCGLDKIDSSFYKTNQTTCKICVRERTATWQTENRERYREISREWGQRNPDKRKHEALKRFHGISLSDYLLLSAKQNNLCAICQNPPLGKRTLAVDHDHKTGKIRGLLCGNCNTALGLLKENPSSLLAACEYLKAS